MTFAAQSTGGTLSEVLVKTRFRIEMGYGVDTASPIPIRKLMVEFLEKLEHQAAAAALKKIQGEER